MSHGGSPQHDRPSTVDEICGRAMQLQIAGRVDLAESLYREILRSDPRHAAANHCLGMLNVQQRRPSQGLPHLLAALEVDPQVPDYWIGYLEALLLDDRIAEAREALELGVSHGLKGAAVTEYAARLAAKLAQGAAAQPTAAQPTAAPHATARIAGSSLDSQAPSPAAPAELTAREPSAQPSAPATQDIGQTRAERRREEHLARRRETALLNLIKQRRFAEAMSMARDISERFPERGPAWKVWGALLWAEGSTDKALVAMRNAVRLIPKDAEVHANFGAALTKAERFAEAETTLRHALELDPNAAAPHLHLGNLLQLQGRYAEAELSVRTAIALRAHDETDDKLVYSSLLFMRSHNPDLDADTLFAEHCAVGALFESQARAVSRHANDTDPERRLRIGLVSGDLCNHAVAYFIESLLSRLGSGLGLELHAYYTNTVEDSVTARLRSHFRGWQQVAAFSDDQLERRIIEDGIDILLDLSGHTSLNRLRVFARKPAPIQISWIGYPGTSGLRTMDYYLADRHFLPPGEFDRHFTEKLVYLPTGAPFRPHDRAPPIGTMPALRKGHITFASFNRPGKVNAATVAVWSRLLRALPASRMMIVGAAPDDRNHRLAGWFGEQGIGIERLMFRPRYAIDDYLALHHEVDICLDTLPYSGGTTTYHAFWMGVPTLTIAGPTPASRQGSAIMRQLGLEAFVACDATDFTDKGVHWSEHLEDLAAVRAGMRERWQRSPIRDPDAITAALVQALRHMWRRRCAGLPAESFEVDSAAAT
jgi:predicted O-linked N-acetylglucosamine transferase (SPINDLY family)